MKGLFLVLLTLVASKEEHYTCARRATELVMAYSSPLDREVIRRLGDIKEDCGFLIGKFEDVAARYHSLEYPNPVACVQEIFSLASHCMQLFQHIKLASEDDIVADFYLIIQDLSAMVVDCVS